MALAVGAMLWPLICSAWPFSKGSMYPLLLIVWWGEARGTRGQLSACG